MGNMKKTRIMCKMRNMRNIKKEDNDDENQQDKGLAITPIF